MKLVRYGNPGEEKPGLIDKDSNLRDLSSILKDIDGNTLDDSTLEMLRAIDLETLSILPQATRIGPCVGNIGKFLCIGLNYSDHAEETGLPIPEHPILFFKANSSVVGCNDTVYLPRGSTHSDWEIELGVIIGKKGKYISANDALSHVAGYCIVNDVSERHFQFNLSGTWDKGKSCDTFGPIGPWLVTRDEIPNPQNLSMSLDLNGRRMQTGNTQTMIFSVAEIIEHLSSLMTLHPGDIISTGTPPGVGTGMKPNPIYLKKGDIMELEIDKLGRQTQPVDQDT
ncbi:MAG: fumarylacetoacetate hydrolase family protein [Proteobacteria bacterium]|jgi:2-keto-4-pentenoate hydratase/2-oxohepta-3-ene-1,7-dioic acid hydratase in catechol pathway|nr:fumarylacetoacetate hydrolase family protein [Pseudomonadota bacterium]